MVDQTDQKTVEMQAVPSAASEPAQYPPPTLYPEVTVGTSSQPYQPVPSDPIAVVLQPQFDQTQFGNKPLQLTCRYCHHEVLTKTSRGLGLIGWVFVLFLFIICLGTCLPLCCIPCCIPSCYDTKHYCPNCGALLGLRSQMIN